MGKASITTSVVPCITRHRNRDWHNLLTNKETWICKWSPESCSIGWQGKQWHCTGGKWGKKEGYGQALVILSMPLSNTQGGTQGRTLLLQKKEDIAFEWYKVIWGPNTQSPQESFSGSGNGYSVMISALYRQTFAQVAIPFLCLCGQQEQSIPCLELGMGSQGISPKLTSPQHVTVERQ